MKNFGLITNLVNALGLKPSQVVAYWQKVGLLSSQNCTSSPTTEKKAIVENMKPRVKQIVAELADVCVEQITDGTLLENDLNLDSLDRVELFLKMEDEFGVKLPDEEAEKVKTVGDIEQLISEHL